MSAHITWRLQALVALTVLLPRCVLIVLSPGEAGDTGIYETVARNIIEHGCVSLSDPATGACVPHWGGNQLPGYPIYLSLVWALFGVSTTIANIGHTCLLALSICWLMHAVCRYTDNSRTAVIVGFVMALSPLLLPWARFAITEPLALCTTIWVLAELLLSFAAGRLRTWQLALPLSLAIFIRYDQVFLCLAVALCGFLIHRPGEALRRGLVIVLLMMIPIGAWWARSVTVGLGMIPNSAVLPDGARSPSGYFDWGHTWMTNQYQYPDWNYPVYTRSYSRISIDPTIYSSDEERERVAELLAALAEYDGQAFPVHIDTEFAALAAVRRAQAPFKSLFLLPVARTWNSWFNPYNSSGWPVAIGPSQVGSMFDLVIDNLGKVAVKAFCALYRIGLLVALLALLAVSGGRSLGRARPILWCAAVVTFGRILFFAVMGLVETRYVLGAVPGLEIALTLAFLELARVRKRMRDGALYQ